MRNRSRLVSLGLVAAAAALACSGAPIPLSVQKGGTFLVPIGGIEDEDWGLIAFGSQVYQDKQRGDLVIRLDGPSGPELVTRAVTALAGPLASQHGIALPYGYRTDLIVVMADVPDVPAITEGHHSLHISKRLGGVETDGPPYLGEIIVLPQTVIANGQPVVGTPTPFQLFSPIIDATTVIKNVVPDPQALFALHVQQVNATQFEITFPDSLVTIKDVTEANMFNGTGYWDGVSESHRAHTWWRTVSAGRIAVGMFSPDRAIRGVSIVFALKAAATGPVAETAFAMQNVQAYDQNGDAVTADWVGPWIR